jgi:hypothetical protein
MATNKAKRSIHLAQPQPQSKRRSLNPNPNPETPEAMPVNASVYRILAEFNTGFEQAIQNIGILSRVKYLASESATDLYNQLCRLRAQANREFMTALNQREAANQGHFGRLGNPAQTLPGGNPATPNATS